MAVAGFLPEPQHWPSSVTICETDANGNSARHARCSLLNHRASFHGRVSVVSGEANGHVKAARLSYSLPGSPADRRPNSFEVIGSAESLVGRVLVEQGLGKYCDADFVRYTSREMQEALDMTQEEMDRAAHQLLLQERQRQQVKNTPSPLVDALEHMDPQL